jgi:hypothetical protein
MSMRTMLGLGAWARPGAAVTASAIATAAPNVPSALIEFPLDMILLGKECTVMPLKATALTQINQ